MVRVALVRRKCIQWEFLLCLAPGFPSASGMTVSSPASVFEESCLCLIDASSRCPCLRESIFAWSSDLFLLLSSFCHLFKFSLISLFFTVFISILVRLWCVDNALIKGEIEECGVLSPGCDE